MKNWNLGWGNENEKLFEEVALDTFYYKKSNNVQFTFDVTSAVQDMVNNPENDFGLMLSAPGGTDQGTTNITGVEAEFVAKNATTNTDKKPVIIVEYDATDIADGLITAPIKGKCIARNFNEGVLFNLPMKIGLNSTIVITTVSGRKIAELDCNGKGRVFWSGESVSSGVYYYRIDGINENTTGAFVKY